MNRADDGVKTVQIFHKNEPKTDILAAEEPLEIRVDGRSVAVVLRTPGAHFEEDLDLARGFLITEGVVDDRDDIRSISHCTDPNREHSGNIVNVSLAMGMKDARERVMQAERDLFVGSSCGVCGKATIDRVFQAIEPIEKSVRLPEHVVVSLPARLREAQNRFTKTGGLHGAVLCSLDGTRLLSAEDIGRHNAVDKVIGAATRKGWLPLDSHLLLVSSRAGFEIVQKALMARIPAVVAIGAASSLAHDLAQSGRLALYSFVSAERYNFHGLESSS